MPPRHIRTTSLAHSTRVERCGCTRPAPNLSSRHKWLRLTMKLAANREDTLSRILKGRVQTCKLNTLESIAAALGYEVKLVKKAD